MPSPGKSHVFQFARIAEGLVDRGHKVALFIGEHFPLDLPELRNRTEMIVVRYRDTTDGVYADYDANEEQATKSSIESGININQQLAIISNV